MFIDGSHDYNYVLSDSKNAFECVKDGGFIVWHDFNSGHLHSVNAILNFCNAHNLKVSWINDTSFAVCKINKKSETNLK